MIPIKKIDINLTHIDKIYLISDVHIRNLKRHDEYIEVFNRLYKEIETTKTVNSIIVLGGDIVHAKTDMTPELVQMVQGFFKKCSDLCYTILITGNHDCNLNNKNRMDALAPIVNAMNHDRLLYLRDSGVYNIANIHFTVMSVFDKPTDFIKANEFEAPYKIALHHGAVDTAKTDTGHVLSNKHVPISMFDGYDLTLLGDIHLPEQYLNVEKTIAYPGSLIQQNYAECIGHGMLVWDVNTKTSKFVEIANDYGFYTMDIVNGKYTLPDNLPNKLRLRLRVTDTTNAEIKEILATVKSKYDILETPIQKVNTIKHNDRTNLTKINLGDVRDIEFQNQLLSEYLKNNYNTVDEIIDGVKHVNRKCNSQLQKLEINRNTVWIPKKFTFDNMFSYGTGNVIDFTQLHGLYGIFAPNTAGKSTLFEALSFCIFDKCNRTSRAEQVLNNVSTEFTSVFEFEINGITYFIERVGKKMKDHVRVTVSFYSISETGDKQMLNGKERSDTNKIIRSYLGTYEDFVLTSMSVQNNNTGFIDAGQRERKELLAQFLDSDIFELLYKIANEESKELSSVIKDLGKQNLDTQIASLEKQIMQLQSEEQKHISQKQSQEQLIQEVVDNITKLSEQIIPITVKLDNIDSLQYQYTDTRNKIDTNELLVSNLESKLTGVTNELNEYNKKLSSVDIEEINTRVSEAGLLQKSLFELQKEEKKIEMDIHHKEEKLKNLDKLEYDENCSYCMNNIFVKDAIQTKSSLSSDYTTKAQLLERIHTKQNELHTISDFEQKKFAYDKLTAVTSKLNADKLKLENEKLKIENSISNLRVQLNILSNDIGLYEQNKESINKNAHTHSLLLNERAKLANLKLDLQKIEQLLNECLYAQSIHKASQLHLNGQLKRYADLQKEYNYYQLYMNAFSRDGVPYQLISKALPKIEAEINNMLSQIVDYEIMLNTDGKNINAFIVYDPDRYWPIELASGMEKFVASIAIRTALINVSSLPRPPFLVIDEGMGNLDADNLNNMYILFDYLKTQFEYVITISHIESMRDMVDSVIEITKSGEKSLISYT